MGEAARDKPHPEFCCQGQPDPCRGCSIEANRPDRAEGLCRCQMHAGI